MKIAIINGSPKGKNSITLQTSIYLSKKYPEHEYKILNASQIIKLLEKDFTRAREILEWAEVIVFSYPVYTFIAPYGLHRFFELVKADGVDLSGKYATQISTSKHFFDVTAARYVEENISDLGMRYVTGLLADMDDLLNKKGREEAVSFFEYFVYSVNEGLDNSRPRRFTEGEYVPATVAVPETESCKELEGKDIVIITDETDPESSLSRMIERFKAKLGVMPRIVNISEYNLQGGCIGCFSCAVSGKCVYTDGFDEFLRTKIQTADAIVYAFTVRDHSMGSRFKMYDDRNFCNGHRTVTVGMPVGYLASGRYSEEENLSNIIEARASVGHNYLAGVATDETDPDREIDALISRLRYALINKYVPPKTFWGVGGMKIFRDLIYQMRGMMRADHKFYKKNGYYDFPQKKWWSSLPMYFVGFLLGNDKIRKKIRGKMNEGMLMPYTKLFKKEFGE
ncbi:MAG: NAD(P)H-dependent oxidoreductase [Clostridia bacterium]|nr:NAD(P)H-dependent oxidoreductase [Clostridia bacterium]